MMTGVPAARGLVVYWNSDSCFQVTNINDGDPVNGRNGIWVFLQTENEMAGATGQHQKEVS